MPLMSRFLRNDPRLQACFMLEGDEITMGDVGNHISRIQEALILLGSKPIGPLELRFKRFGVETQQSLCHFNGMTSRFGQGRRDTVIDRHLLAELDRTLLKMEGAAPNPILGVP